MNFVIGILMVFLRKIALFEHNISFTNMNKRKETHTFRTYTYYDLVRRPCNYLDFHDVCNFHT